MSTRATLDNLERSAARVGAEGDLDRITLEQRPAAPGSFGAEQAKRDVIRTSLWLMGGALVLAVASRRR
jgi:hypothetical protein